MQQRIDLQTAGAARIRLDVAATEKKKGAQQDPVGSKDNVSGRT